MWEVIFPTIRSAHRRIQTEIRMAKFQTRKTWDELLPTDVLGCDPNWPIFEQSNRKPAFFPSVYIIMCYFVEIINKMFF